MHVAITTLSNAFLNDSAAPHNPRETVQARQTDREGEGEPGKGEGINRSAVFFAIEGIESWFCVAPFFVVFGVPGIIADILLVPCGSRTKSV